MNQGEARLDLGKVAAQPLLVVTILEPGGSACGIEHLIVGYAGKLFEGSEDLRILAPMRLLHSESGGFYVGDLGKGHGAGLAVWDAHPEGEGHSAAHRYQMTVYRWVDDRFSAPIVLTTRKRVEGGDDVPKLLGYSLHDQSGQERFDGC